MQRFLKSPSTSRQLAPATRVSSAGMKERQHSCHKPASLPRKIQSQPAVPSIAKFYSHRRPALRLIYGLCEGAYSIAFEKRTSSIQKSKINNLSVVALANPSPQPIRHRLREVGSSISPDLPLIGSFQLPAAAPAQYAFRVVRQSAVDWLFDAIIRSVSPAQFAKDAEIRSFEANARHLVLLPLFP